MSHYSSRTTKTYTFSSGGPGGTRTETRTVTDQDGKRSQTVTYGGDSNGMSSRGRVSNAGNIRSSKSKPVESRYSSGWGSRVRPKSKQVSLAGKTYEQVRDECLSNGVLFEDPDFPAVDKTIFFSRPPPRPFVWKRPTEITDNPQWFVGGASRFDVKQGELGDCWLLAAVSGLCGCKELLYRVVPPDQDFTTKYCGIFRFQFWQYGKWTEILVDDRLPTYNNKLVFMHSQDMNEFWSPLLEKAYAKLCGSYEALKGGSTCEAMEDFTGGVTEMFDLRQAPPNLFQIMLKAYERNSQMGCSIDADPNQTEAKLTNGLIMGHAYTITRVAFVDIKTSRTEGRLPMIRVRNPWGDDHEWNGAWSDKSREWSLISEEEREEHGLNFSDDGEFWMAFKDFQANFQKVEICNLGPDSLTEELASTMQRKWQATNHDGAWIRSVTAGGCRNYLDTFWTNPQYRIDVTDPDEGDDEDAGTIIVGLMQKERRKKRSEGLDMLTIGYAIYKLKDDASSGPMDIKYFKYNASVAKSPSFINMREICGRHKLPPGSYCIVPSTFEPNQEADFLLRVFSEKEQGAAGEMDEETKMDDVQPSAELTDEDVRQDEQMREAFRRISGDDMEIDAYELQDILNNAFLKANEQFKFDGFSADTCRGMVAMMDEDCSGMLGYDEFKKVWNDLRLWKGVFKQYDKDRSGNFNSFELRQAFHAIGFKVSNATFNGLVKRYSNRDGKIQFDDYIHCVARLKTMFSVFKEAMVADGSANFSLDHFIQTTMYA
ncbi:hypothetical protein CAPTEDRAFT_151195 [Capitella teleta]|uniref:Calpain catalytic domain-containing protein n=1 Tax=Capitella teleta TaxID=283909 RepID=R7UAB6_CAPTE|nr:hypothetical protein CAPTEDRAFT_151195 [Capitella teleta]|eukprot:ELU02909.1 hypothetical protein CAPTEDRAFT_151195 [Capitella teleta]